MNGRTICLPTSLTKQIRNASTLMAEIDAATKRVAQLMDQLHGEECRYMISHKAGAEVICIAPGIKQGGSSRGAPVDNGDSGGN